MGWMCFDGDGSEGLKTNKDNVILVLGWAGRPVSIKCKMFLSCRHFVCLLILREKCCSITLIIQLNLTRYYLCLSLMKMELINQTFGVKHVLIISFQTIQSEAEFQIS